MAKTQAPASAADESTSAPAPVAAPAPAPAAAPAVEMTLTEACVLFSGRAAGKPVGTALLAAFHFNEEAEGRLTGTQADFRERLAAFRAAPAA